MMHCHTYIK